MTKRTTNKYIEVIRSLKGVPRCFDRAGRSILGGKYRLVGYQGMGSVYTLTFKGPKKDLIKLTWDYWPDEEELEELEGQDDAN